MSKALAAAVQMCSGDDKEANLAVAAGLLGEAAGRGAQLAVLPEMFNNLGSGRILREGAEPLPGPTTDFACEQASKLGIWLVAGSFIEAAESGDRYNTCVVVTPVGEIAAIYRKVHLFDVQVPGASFRESNVIRPGSELVLVDAEGIGTIGCSVCYDLRFPELYRILALRGADVLAVPAAFTAETGPPHWEVLLRARAIENQAYVVAAGQHGVTRSRDGSSIAALGWHGHSMIVDPWGTVMGKARDGDGVVIAEIDLSRLGQVRACLPSLANRRPGAYRWPSAPEGSAH